MMKVCITAFSALFLSAWIYAQNLLPDTWKFHTGFEPEWIKPNFDDKGWENLSTKSVWEQQGYAAYDGYATYRVTFNIPSVYRKNASRNGGFQLILGKVDDVDYTYFNGILLGHTGELPPNYLTKFDDIRIYSIPLSLLKWDQPNTITVKVFDLTGNGGIYAGPPSLVIKGFYENIRIEPRFPTSDRIFTGDEEINLNLNIINDTRKEFTAKLELSVLNDLGKELYSSRQQVTVSKKGTMKAGMPLGKLSPGFYKGIARLESGIFSSSLTFNFGDNPLQYVIPPDRQPDFTSFWETAKKELAEIAPSYRWIKVDSLCCEKKDLFLVEMRSLGNALIRGWLSVPKTPGKYPVIMQVPGYSSTIMPEYIYYADDIIGFGLNIRGHGNSCDDVNPGFPGYILNHLDNKDNYIYRGAYMDCVRAVDFICTLPQADLSRIVVEGASQGGALTFATAALNSDRIRLCVPMVPFLSDFPHYFKCASWPANEFINYVEVEKKGTWSDVYKTLSYFDIRNLAPWIKAPMLMSSGLCDEVCPSSINFAAFNNVPGEKEYIVYPLAGHGVPQDFYPKKMEWIRKHLNN